MFMKQSEKLLIGSRYKNLINIDFVKNVEYIPDNPFIDNRLSGHVDLSVFSDGKGTVFTAKHLNIPNSIVVKEDQSPEYPNDVQLNACIVGNNVILNEKYVSREILNHLEAGKWNIIDVNQGYAKCSTLVIDDNSIITSDTGIYKAAQANGIDSLVICPGYISLEGYDYGFIGGSGFVYDDTVYFTGILNNHPNMVDITQFVTNKGLTIKTLTNRQIFDIGGVVFI